MVLPGPGANVVTAATVTDNAWLMNHAVNVRGRSVLKVHGTRRTIPNANLVRIARRA